MTRRRKRSDDEMPGRKDRDYYRKRSEEARAHLRGRPAPPEWEKGGVVKKLNQNQGTMNRKERRELVFGLAVRKRAERNDHESKFTKPALGARARRRRSANKRARAARRRNR